MSPPLALGVTMNRFRSFVSDTRGNGTTRIAVAAGVLSFFAILGATSMDRAARDGSLARIAAALKGENPQVATNRPRTGPYDFTATGSIEQSARNVILDPCLGIPK